jgi:hypothetical protein
LSWHSENVNREEAHTAESPLCDFTQQPDEEPNYVCMSVLLKMADKQTFHNVSVNLPKHFSKLTPTEKCENTKVEATSNFRKKFIKLRTLKL